MTMKPANKIAVIISDVHYSINTLELADNAMRQAITKANKLKVPLIIAGDLNDTKAIMRAECVNAMIKTFNLCQSPPYFLVGNHDRINERASDHSLNFLRQFGYMIDTPVKQHKLGYLIPYYHDPEELKSYLKTLPKGSQLIMHQGIQGTNSGDYIQDKSALTTEDVASFRVISGHYHTRQQIRLPDSGVWDYVGNPYTLNFAEANDPEKGFRILDADGLLTFVPTNLRKHVVLDVTPIANGGIQITGKVPPEDIKSADLVKIRLRGTREKLSSFTKEVVSGYFKEISSFRLEYIYNDSKQEIKENKSLSQSETLDAIIDSTNSSEDGKIILKNMWRALCE